MARRRRYSRRFGIELALAVFAFAGLAVLISGLHISRAGVNGGDDNDMGLQVTVFGVLATPDGKTLDPRLSSVHKQLENLLPKNGFRLLDARSERIVDGEAVTCNLENGYSLTTTLVKSLDENGKVELRCELLHEKQSDFSTLVKTPVSQLFFCQRSLNDGSKLLIGVGAR
jgi:hypothetical protein